MLVISVYCFQAPSPQKKDQKLKRNGTYFSLYLFKIFDNSVIHCILVSFHNEIVPKKWLSCRFF